MGDWRDRAACLGVNPELFFPAGSGDDSYHTTGNDEINAVKKICRMCPVRAACLDEALARGERWGIWGGTTAAERRGTARVRTKVAAGMCPNGRHPWTGANVRHDRRGGVYCVECRRDCARKSYETVLRRRWAMDEQFPPVGELVQELPGVRDRVRRRGRTAVRAL